MTAEERTIALQACVTISLIMSLIVVARFIVGPMASYSEIVGYISGLGLGVVLCVTVYRTGYPNLTKNPSTSPVNPLVVGVVGILSVILARILPSITGFTVTHWFIGLTMASLLTTVPFMLLLLLLRKSM